MVQDHGPQIKDDEQHEALRKQAAYEEWTGDELSERARETGIEGRSRRRKDQLITAMRRH